MAIAHRACDQCKNKWHPDIVCTSCGQHRYVFKGDNVKEEFFSWLFSDENNGATIFAHNFKGQSIILGTNGVLPRLQAALGTIRLPVECVFQREHIPK